jgi:hypothetical protein
MSIYRANKITPQKVQIKKPFSKAKKNWESPVVDFVFGLEVPFGKMI